MHLPTFNYYSVLQETIEDMSGPDTSSEMVFMTMPVKKWKKHQEKCERNAHEWIHDGDSIPIANMYSLLIDSASDDDGDD